MNRQELRLLAKLLQERATRTRQESADILSDLAFVCLEMADQLPRAEGDESCEECGAEWVHNGNGSKTMLHNMQCVALERKLRGDSLPTPT